MPIHLAGYAEGVRLEFLKPLYEVPGPFVSVYLDVSQDAEDAGRAIGLRWRGARERLGQQGADATDLDAVERAVGEVDLREQWPEGEQGQVIFAAGGDVVWNELLPYRPRRGIATVSQLPHAMPYVVQRSERIPYVRVVIDRQGAEVLAMSSDGLPRGAAVKGADYPIHKPRGGEWANKRFHRAAEHAWQQGAIDAAVETERAAIHTGAEVIVVSGDRQVGRMMVDQLRETLRDRVVETESGARADGTADATLDAKLVRATRAKAAEHIDGVVGAYRREAGQRDRAADGLADTVNALRKAQVEALLLNDDPTSVAELWAGPDPVHIATRPSELRDMGVAEPVVDRADAALVRGVVGVDAELLTVPAEQLRLADGVGALLRY